MARLWSDAKRTLTCAETHDKTVKNDAKAFNEGSISKTILGRCACATLFGLLSPNVRISIGGTRSWCEWGMFVCTITHCLPGLVDRTVSAKRPIPLVVGVEPPENWDWNWFRFVQERSVITPKNRYPQWLQPNPQHASGHVVRCPVPCLHKVSARCWALATGATWAGCLSCGKTWTALLLSVASWQPGTWWNAWHVESWTYWHLTWWVVVCGTCYMWIHVANFMYNSLSQGQRATLSHQQVPVAAHLWADGTTVACKDNFLVEIRWPRDHHTKVTWGLHHVASNTYSKSRGPSHPWFQEDS